MTSDLVVRPATPADRLPLYRMLELYQHDLSDLWDQDLDAHGEYGYPLDRYWDRADGWPYLFLLAGNFAGFALVDKRVRIDGDDFWMDQFFVLKKYRRRGVGTAGATAVFDRHPGRWQVGQMPDNHAAREFWLRVIGAYAARHFSEEWFAAEWWQGHIQRFTAPGGA